MTRSQPLRRARNIHTHCPTIIGRKRCFAGDETNLGTPAPASPRHVRVPHDVTTNECTRHLVPGNPGTGLKQRFSGYKGISIVVWETKDVLKCPPAPAACAFPTGQSVLDYLEFEGGNEQLFFNAIILVSLL